MQRDRIVSFIDDYLEISSITDDSINGLQFYGREDIKKAAFAVDASVDTIKKACMDNADILFVHHGILWIYQKPEPYTKQKKVILEPLFKHNMNLYAAHLPLDRHRNIGNNAQIMKKLGIKIKGEWASYHGVNIGYFGDVKPQSIDALSQRVNHVFGWDARIVKSHDRKIKRVGVVSGGAHAAIREAPDYGIDAFIIGEIPHYAYHEARLYGVDLIICGHYNTETVGIKALMNLIKKRFRIETVFYDFPTGF